MPTDPTQIAPERNRYFYGLMMDAERFSRDQAYFNGKRQLLNRFVTGAGVVSGLGLTLDSATNGLTLQPLNGSERASSRLFNRSPAVWPGNPAMKPELTLQPFSASSRM